MIPQKGWAADLVGIPILYYLKRDEALKEKRLRLPKSTRTVHRLLKENGRIAPPLPILTAPLERPAPMQQWQLDAHSTPPVSLRIRMAKSSMWWKHGSIIDKGTGIC